MIWIDSAHCRDNAIIERDEPRMARVGRLIHGIISSNPGIPSVMLCELLPKPNNSVFEVFVPPEIAKMYARIAVPATILATWACMQVENSIDAILGTHVNNTIEMLETGSL